MTCVIMNLVNMTYARRESPGSPVIRADILCKEGHGMIPVRGSDFIFGQLQSVTNFEQPMLENTREMLKFSLITS